MEEQETLETTESETVQEDGKQEQTQESIEDIARTMGWRDKDEYHSKNGKPWVSAKDFILREHDFTDRIKNKLESLEGTVKNIHEHFERQREVDLKKMREELKAQKVEAIRESDVDEVERIEQQMAELDDEDDDLSGNPNKEILEKWREKNPWYTVDAELTEMANEIAQSLEEKADLTTILNTIDKAVKRIDKAEKSSEQTRKKVVASPVEGDSVHGNTGSRKHTARDLTDAQKDILKVFKAQIPGYTEERYIKELEEQGVLR